MDKGRGPVEEDEELTEAIRQTIRKIRSEKRRSQ
jgi:hypothetical protein